MAGLWYRAGTVAVTSGSKKVVGTGTLWKTAVYKPDKGHLVWGPDGKPYELDYVESDTVLYLVTAYAGVTAAGQAYAIDITRTSTIPALSREISAQLAYAQAQYDAWQLILTGAGTVTLTAPDGQQVQVPSMVSMQQSSDSLMALMALAPAADKLPYFNGPKGAALATFTALARSLLAGATDADMRGTLKVPGLYSGNAAGMDCNALVSPGVHRLGPSPLNGPPGVSGASYSQLEVDFGASDTLTQKMAIYNSGELWVRTGQLISGAWTFQPWRKQYDTRNILGTVSQSGGIPTGAIIEQGSNANGEYVKFANGTMWCFGVFNVTGYAITNPVGSLFQGTAATPVIPFPAGFIAAPLVMSDIFTVTGNARAWTIPVITTATYFTRTLQAAATSNPFSGVLNYIAIGRWYQ